MHGTAGCPRVHSWVTTPLNVKDVRSTVEGVLSATLAGSHGILPRERWMQVLQDIGGAEQGSYALLKDQEADLSVEHFLNIIFGPKEGMPKVFLKEAGRSSVTDNLRDFFEIHYREGGEFRHPDYERVPTDVYTWRHLPTDIQVWQDAIDLTAGTGGRVFFHYTSGLAFRNIGAPEKKAAEVWASLNSEPGPNQNAWWGKGVYSVPKPPDEWQDCSQLLDNNFRNMMARDRADPQRGPTYVENEYPKRVAYCIPIIIDEENAFDVSVRATPEMEAAGKKPGVNLGDKLLNEPGKPPRCCVVLRVSGDKGDPVCGYSLEQGKLVRCLGDVPCGSSVMVAIQLPQVAFFQAFFPAKHQVEVQHAQGQLLEVLRRRAASSADIMPKWRLGIVLRRRGLYDEALPILRELLVISEATEGPESHRALAAMTNLANVLVQMGRYNEAVELQRRDLKAKEAKLGEEHQWTLISRSNLAITLCDMADYSEAAELHRKSLEIRRRTLGDEHRDTLNSMTELAVVLDHMGKHTEAAEMQRKALERMEKTLGAEHPLTLFSTNALGIVLRHLGSCGEAAALHKRAFSVRERILGAEHPETLGSLSDLAMAWHASGEVNEALELQQRALSGRQKVLGIEHPDTKLSQQRLEDLLCDLASIDAARLKP